MQWPLDKMVSIDRKKKYNLAFYDFVQWKQYYNDNPCEPMFTLWGDIVNTPVCSMIRKNFGTAPPSFPTDPGTGRAFVPSVLRWTTPFPPPIRLREGHSAFALTQAVIVRCTDTHIGWVGGVGVRTVAQRGGEKANKSVGVRLFSCVDVTNVFRWCYSVLVQCVNSF